MLVASTVTTVNALQNGEIAPNLGPVRVFGSAQVTIRNSLDQAVG